MKEKMVQNQATTYMPPCNVACTASNMSRDWWAWVWKRGRTKNYTNLVWARKRLCRRFGYAPSIALFGHLVQKFLSIHHCQFLSHLSHYSLLCRFRICRRSWRIEKTRHFWRRKGRRFRTFSLVTSVTWIDRIMNFVFMVPLWRICSSFL